MPPSAPRQKPAAAVNIISDVMRGFVSSTYAAIRARAPIAGACSVATGACTSIAVLFIRSELSGEFPLPLGEGQGEGPTGQPHLFLLTLAGGEEVILI